MPTPSHVMLIIGDGVLIADDEIHVTCPKCKLKLNALQKKIIRLLYQKPRQFGTGRKFDYNDRIIYLTHKTRLNLQYRKLVLQGRDTMLIPGSLRQYAAQLPEVKDDF